jgi:hypothetical protein
MISLKHKGGNMSDPDQLQKTFQIIMNLFRSEEHVRNWSGFNLQVFNKIVVIVDNQKFVISSSPIPWSPVVLSAIKLSL